jgi:lipoteichoic acid synthase
LKKQKGIIFSSYMSLFTVLVVLGFISQLDLNFSELSVGSLPSVLSLFDLFLVELCIMLLIGVWLLSCNIWGRILLYIFSSLFITIYSLQFASFYQGREFVSRLAIDNINHISLLINSQSIKGLVFLSFICLILPLVIEKKTDAGHYWGPGKSIIFSLFLVSLAVCLYQSSHWLPKSVIEQRNSYLRDFSLPHTAPVSALYTTLFIHDSLFAAELGHSDFSPYELQVIQNFGFQYSPDSKYPLIREDIYSEPAPFEREENQAENPNIIVFFTEGFSARAINTYGSQHPEITPNIDDFAKSSMVVENYYNHTAATYRGLHGQLCSLFPTYGGDEGWQTNYDDLPEVNYYCLSNVFNKNGYETIFLDAHIEHESQVDEMMTQLGFKRVITGGVLSQKYLGNAKPKLKFALSDKQFFEGLIDFLKVHEKDNRKKPFFMSLYNLGTHAFLGVTRDAKKYGNRKNRSLNTIHTLDSAFGRFWEYYKTSPYSENTIVIFTADHCHYPERAFVDAFEGPGYQNIFVDKIPLIIHDPTRKLPKTFDARNSTSLDFTPSLIHYLDLGNHKNPFMGTSMYEQRRKKYERYGLSSIGTQELYLIDDEKIHKLGTSQNHRVKLKIMDKYITLSKQLEITDKLWDVALDPEL